MSTMPQPFHQRTVRRSSGVPSLGTALDGVGVLDTLKSKVPKMPIPQSWTCPEVTKEGKGDCGGWVEISPDDCQSDNQSNPKDIATENKHLYTTSAIADHSTIIVNPEGQNTNTAKVGARPEKPVYFCSNRIEDFVEKARDKWNRHLNDDDIQAPEWCHEGSLDSGTTALTIALSDLENGTFSRLFSSNSGKLISKGCVTANFMISVVCDSYFCNTELSIIDDSRLWGCKIYAPGPGTKSRMTLTRMGL